MLALLQAVRADQQAQAGRVDALAAQLAALTTALESRALGTSTSTSSTCLITKKLLLKRMTADAVRHPAPGPFEPPRGMLRALA